MSLFSLSSCDTEEQSSIIINTLHLLLPKPLLSALYRVKVAKFWILVIDFASTLRASSLVTDLIIIFGH
ncbi:hypothetical protein AAHA92_12888 [Salvia divinorum]|uniref:Uncharacterized protein n=1 Tax=Salvia divinorum TaxID=28513 RepID=A0ABD1HAR9_SALDI